MRKKNNTPNGSLFSPEMKEVLRRLKTKEPEVDEIIDRVAGLEEHKEGKDYGSETTDEGTAD
jgi:hypothetical protein